MILTADLSGLDPEARERVVKQLQHEDAAQYALGAVKQARMKKFYDDIVQPGVTKDEFGPLSMVISADQAARCRALYGDLCFMDEEFVAWLKKRNEDFRVREVGTKMQVGWTPQLQK